MSGDDVGERGAPVLDVLLLREREVSVGERANELRAAELRRQEARDRVSDALTGLLLAALAAYVGFRVVRAVIVAAAMHGGGDA